MTTTSSPHDQVKAAVLMVDPSPRWDVVMVLLGHQGAALARLWPGAATAVRVALAVERRLGMPGLAELVARHEWLRARAPRPTR